MTSGTIPIETENVRGAVVLAMEGFWHPDAGADFDRWLADVKAEVWDEAVATSRSILHRRSPYHYETDIDMIVEPNPYRQEPTDVHPA